PARCDRRAARAWFRRNLGLDRRVRYRMAMSTLAMSPELSTSMTRTQPLRVMIAGGGTGGHLFPGIALAEQIVAGGGQVRFVGTERGIEARVVPQQGYGLDLIEVSGIKGRGLEGLISGLLRLPR